METPRDAVGELGADRCAEQRQLVARTCDAAGRAQSEHVAITQHLHELRRRHVGAERDLAMAEAAANPRLRTAEKARARDDFEHARAIAAGQAEQRQAVADWGRSLDSINRTGRLARRAVNKATLQLKHIVDELHLADRSERTARLAAETAEAACLDARVRLASCQEQGAKAATRLAESSPFEPHAATGGHAIAVPALRRTEPLVIESMVSGDRRALELASASIAEHSGLTPAQAMLHVQEFVDAIISVASSEGFLLFDASHHFWSHLSVEEAGDVIAALARLGFQFEPAEGWHAGRSPAPSDLSTALAYAGLDARNMRDLPSADELRRLPESISVDARSFLAQVAPDLAVDQLVGVLGRRAKPLEPLWDEWGQIRPILLSDRRQLGRLQG